MRSQLDQELALEQRFTDQPHVKVLEVPEAAVNHFRGAG